jgi:hypothetical protein
MKVLLFGATGFTGKAVLPELLANNHVVTALVRSKNGVDLKHPNLRVIEGDVLDQSQINAAMEGQEAVINCLGKNKGSDLNLISSFTNKVIRAMEEKKVSRLILRFPKISEKPSQKRILISQDGKGLSFSISLKDCTEFIVSQLEDKSLYFKTPSISN